MTSKSFCRLCAETKEQALLVNITDPVALNLNLGYKILHCFHLKIDDDDTLPRTVCSNCCEQVIVTYNFNECIQKAQKTLREALNNIQSMECSDVHETKDIIQKIEPYTSENDSCSIEDNLVECLLSESELQQPKAEEIREEMHSIKNENGDSPQSDIKLSSKTKRRFCSKQKTNRCKRRKRKKISTPQEEKETANDSDGVSVALLESFDVESNDDGSVILKPPKPGWDTYPWSCFTCQNLLPSLFDLRQHHTTVHNQSTHYSCADCNNPPYASYHGFLTHVRTHRPYLKYCCDLCGHFFRRQHVMELHRLSHSELRSHFCQLCGKSFRTQSALCLHSRTHLPDSEKNQFACDVCPKKFGTKPNLVAHKRIHAGIKDYTCDQCGKSFIQKGNLENHLLTHTVARPFKCELCSKTFKTVMRLKKHESVHSGLKPHQCDICGRQFREKGTLKEHHRIHTGARPFCCEFCGKSFRFKGVLTTHRRQHTGERPYSCLECQHHFTNWPNYNKHMKRRHGINTSVTVRKPQTIPPTGMPCRNLPGTVIVPPVGLMNDVQSISESQDIPAPHMLVLQDTNSVPSSPICQEVPTAYLNTVEVNVALDSAGPGGILNSNIPQDRTQATAIATVLGVPPPQTYYNMPSVMPSVIGLYNLHTVDTSQYSTQPT